MDKILDLSCCPDDEFENIKRGFKVFNESTGERFFGYVNIDELNKDFAKVARKNFVKGGVVALVAFGVGRSIYRRKKAKKKSEEEKAE